MKLNALAEGTVTRLPSAVHQQPHRLSVAPMMGWTDRHCRRFHRLIAPCACLFTEMIPVDVIIHRPDYHKLSFSPVEKPLTLQVGGSCPSSLAKASRTGFELGFDEINLNIGCPSKNVRAGGFGAILMSDPQIVANCISAMKDASPLPVSIKCRIGIDAQDPETELPLFLDSCVKAGASRLIVHGRKALLSGINPAENRRIPPLQPRIVYRMKARYPTIPIIYNGGITTLDDAHSHLHHVDGIMVGRAAFRKPAFLATLAILISSGKEPSADAVSDRCKHAVLAYSDYVCQNISRSFHPISLIRPLLGMFFGQPGDRALRAQLSSMPISPTSFSLAVSKAVARRSSFEFQTG